MQKKLKYWLVIQVPIFLVSYLMQIYGSKSGVDFYKHIYNVEPVDDWVVLKRLGIKGIWFPFISRLSFFVIALFVAFFAFKRFWFGGAIDSAAQSGSEAKQASNSIVPLPSQERVVDIFDNPDLKRWELKRIQVKDEIGRKADLITIVSRDFYWRLGSDSDFEYAGSTADFVSHIRTPGMLALLERFSAIVAVGAASHETQKVSDPLAFEEARARRRSERLQLLLKENVPANAAIYALSIGRNSRVVESSHSQRLVVVLGIMGADVDFDINSMLCVNLKLIEHFPFDLSSYSSFSLVRMR